jgi:hypothetical protein
MKKRWMIAATVAFAGAGLCSQTASTIQAAQTMRHARTAAPVTNVCASVGGWCFDSGTSSTSVQALRPAAKLNHQRNYCASVGGWCFDSGSEAKP